jgi:hypothetical protein
MRRQCEPHVYDRQPTRGPCPLWVTTSMAIANFDPWECRVQVVRSLTPGITLAFSVWLLKKSATKEAIGYAGHPCSRSVSSAAHPGPMLVLVLAGR